MLKPWERDGLERLRKRPDGQDREQISIEIGDHDEEPETSPTRPDEEGYEIGGEPSGRSRDRGVTIIDISGEEKN